MVAPGSDRRGSRSAFGRELRVEEPDQPSRLFIDEPAVTEHVRHQRAGRRLQLTGGATVAVTGRPRSVRGVWALR